MSSIERNMLITDGSYFVLGSVEAEIWPGKSTGLVKGKMGKSRSKNA